MGIDAIPLRTQPDRRLVRLVREGYESAFEEIVRRYRRPLDRFAASIVGGRSEDVTQDSFRKALEALRRDDAEIELRPWLYRIVRNTALNDLRDRPPAAAELAEDLMVGGRSAAAEAEQRAEVIALTEKLRALPENQRAALVMRELEGMSHERIAAVLGISDGAARQAIARGRAAVRTGFGALVPLPLLRVLVGGGDAASEVAGAGAAGLGSGAAAGGMGATLLGGGAALKVGLATVVLAGGIGAGVAIDHHRGAPVADPPRAAAQPPTRTTSPVRPAADPVRPSPSPVVANAGAAHRHASDPGHGHGSGDRRRERIEPETEVEVEHTVASTPTVSPTPTVVVDHVRASGGSNDGGPGPSRSSGSHEASGHSEEERPGDDRSGSDGGGGDDLAEDVAKTPVAEAPPVEPAPAPEAASPETSSSSGPGPSSSSGDDGSGSSGGHGSDDDLEVSP